MRGFQAMPVSRSGIVLSTTGSGLEVPVFTSELCEVEFESVPGSKLENVEAVVREDELSGSPEETKLV